MTHVKIKFYLSIKGTPLASVEIQVVDLNLLYRLKKEFIWNILLMTVLWSNILSVFWVG